jgi:hypothetical protein
MRDFTTGVNPFGALGPPGHVTSRRKDYVWFLVGFG